MKGFRPLLKVKKKIAKIQCYEHYKKDYSKLKRGYDKKDRESHPFHQRSGGSWKKEVQGRGKALEVRARDITIGNMKDVW